MSLFMYDLETGGLSPQFDAILQVAGFIVDEKLEVVDKICFYCQPHCADNNPNPRALEVNHISPSDIDEFMSSEEGVAKLNGFLQKHVEGEKKLTLAGYNSDGFDNLFLENWYKKHDDFASFDSFFHTKTVDVLKVAKGFFSNKVHKPFNFKQGTVAKYLKVEIDDSRLHEALYDVEVCLEIYRKLMQLKKG